MTKDVILIGMEKIFIHHHVIDKLAFLNGVISGVALYPQMISVLMGGSVEGISLATFIIVGLNSVVWILYAIHRSLLSLFIASLLNFISSTILVVALVVLR